MRRLLLGPRGACSGVQVRQACCPAASAPGRLQWPPHHRRLRRPCGLAQGPPQAAQGGSGVRACGGRVGGKGLGSVLGSELAVQPQATPFTSLGLSFSTSEVNTPLWVSHAAACAAPGSGGSGSVSCESHPRKAFTDLGGFPPQQGSYNDKTCLEVASHHRRHPERGWVCCVEAGNGSMRMPKVISGSKARTAGGSFRGFGVRPPWVFILAPLPLKTQY